MENSKLQPGLAINIIGLGEKEIKELFNLLLDHGAKPGPAGMSFLLKQALGAGKEYDYIAWSRGNRIGLLKESEIEYHASEVAHHSEFLSNPARPPEGTIWNCKHNGSDQGRVKIRHMGEEFCILENLEDGREQCGRVEDYEFSRVPTEEQKLLDQMVSHVIHHPLSANTTIRDVCRALLREGYRQAPQPKVSFRNPQGWREGDLVVCVDEKANAPSSYTRGSTYPITYVDEDGRPQTVDDDGDEQWIVVPRAFRAFTPVLL